MPATAITDSTILATDGAHALDHKRWVDVKARAAAVGDGVADDTSHLKTGIDAGRASFIPEGIYKVTGTGLIPASASGVHVSGAGWGSIIRRADVAGNFGIGVFDNCDNLIIENLAIDVNHITQYGGLNISNSDNVILRNLHLFDSNLDAGWTSFDHYSLIVQNCTNVIIEDCFAEDVELLEVDNCERVIVRNNVSLRSAGTTSIGHFTVGNGYYLRDAVFENNLIIDPRKGGICLHHESGGLSNNEWRRIRISGNHIVHSTVQGTAEGISVGNFTGNNTGSGNVYDDIVIENNHFYIAPALTRTNVELYCHLGNAERLQLWIRNNTFQGNINGEWAVRAERMNKGEIKGNTIINTHASGSGVAMDRLSNVTVSDNRVQGGASGGAYNFANSEGTNRFERNETAGSPGTPYGVTAGTADIIRDNRGLVGNAVVTGSRGANAALASLLTQLQTLGVITDSST